MTEQDLLKEIKIPPIEPEEPLAAAEEAADNSASFSIELPPEEAPDEVANDINMEWVIEDAPDSADFYEDATVHTDDSPYTKTRSYTYDALNTRSCNKHIYTWIFSFFLGMFGIDRFVRGQIGLGILKFLTSGGFGFWYLADLVIAIMKSYLGEYRDIDDVIFDLDGNYIY